MGLTHYFCLVLLKVWLWSLASRPQIQSSLVTPCLWNLSQVTVIVYLPSFLFIASIANSAGKTEHNSCDNISFSKPHMQPNISINCSRSDCLCSWKHKYILIVRILLQQIIHKARHKSERKFQS